MTGKGVRWGRTVGRSAPAFMAASTPALPHLPARRGTSQVIGSCCCLLRGRIIAVSSRPVPSGGSAGCVCLQCCSAGCVLPAMPTALLISSCPRSILLAPVHFASFCLPPAHSMCARIAISRAGDCFQTGPAVCKLQDCPVGSCNTGLQWRPVRRSIC